MPPAYIAPHPHRPVQSGPPNNHLLLNQQREPVKSRGYSRETEKLSPDWSHGHLLTFYQYVHLQDTTTTVTSRTSHITMLSHILKSSALAQCPCGLVTVLTRTSGRAPSSLPRLARLTTTAQAAHNGDSVSKLAAELMDQAPHPTAGNGLAGISGTSAGPSATTSTAAVASKEKLDTSQAVIDQQDEFWRRTRVWADTPAKDFLSYRWGVSLTKQSSTKSMHSHAD